MSQKSISFHTLGCRLNQSETAVIRRTFENNDYRVVEFSEPADIVVINTCTVTRNGDTDTRKLVNKVAKRHPHSRIALIGCQAQVQKEKLAQHPNVRWVVGTEKKFDLIPIIEREHSDSKECCVIIPRISKESFTVPTAAIDRHKTRANLKIQDGCDFFCSFCEIPFARGRARSREFDDILTEAKTLADAGYQELVITGINVGCYKNNSRTILDVIEALEQIEHVARIRISSIEPTTIPISLLPKMARHQKLCRHLHIPLQSGSDVILQKMKRKYTTKEFCDFIHLAHETVSQICIGTDIIVGFPGETEECFRQTLELLEQSPIHYFHVFSYSKRHSAQSRLLDDPVDTTVIQQRSKLLRDLGKKKRTTFHQSLVGTEQRVLIEEKKGEYLTGLTDNYVRVNIRSNASLTNQFVNLTLGEATDKNVLGTMKEK